MIGENSAKLPTWLGAVMLVIGLVMGGIIGSWYHQLQDHGAVLPVVVTVELNFGNGTVLTFEQVELEKNTPLEALYVACGLEMANMSVKTTYYALFDSTMVDSVGNFENGQDLRYWQYYVNGEMPMEGADRVKLNNGDRVVWSFEVPSWI